MRFTVSAADAGQRLDQFLTGRVPELSRSRIQHLIRDGHVRVEPGRAKPGLIVGVDVAVDIDVPAPTPAAPRAEALPLTLLHDDADIVVVDKPAGMVVHPAAGHAQ